MGLMVALFAILFSCQWAARMADKRGAGYVVQYTVLMAVMGLIGGVVCILWEIHTPHRVTLVSGAALSFIWLSCAFSSLNHRVNPGVIIFALMATIFFAIGESEFAEPTRFWPASFMAVSWAVSGWVVRRDYSGPGLLALVLIATVPFSVASPF